MRGAGRKASDWWSRVDKRGLRKGEEVLRGHGIDPADLAKPLIADAAPQVRKLNDTKPALLADVLAGMQQGGKTATKVASDVNAAHGSKLSPQQVGRINAAFERANPVPGDMLELAKKAGVPEPKIKGLTQAIAPEAERVAVQGWREFADVPTDLTGVVKLAAKRLAEAADARNAEQLRQLMTQTDPRVLYMALQEMQRMSPGIRDLEQLCKMAGMGASAVTGQVRNQDYEPDPDRYYMSIRERRPRPINE